MRSRRWTRHRLSTITGRSRWSMPNAARWSPATRLTRSRRARLRSRTAHPAMATNMVVARIASAVVAVVAADMPTIEVATLSEDASRALLCEATGIGTTS